MAGTLSAIKAALAARQARAQVRELDAIKGDPIAIVGLGCRFPGGANSPQAFWSLLEQGVDAVTEVPGDRWDVDALYDPDPAAPGRMNTRWGAFLADVDQFDPKFFGIAPREAASMDPQQRVLLEVAWEALEDAGFTHEMLAGSETGVFFAVYNSDYATWQIADPSRIDAYTGLGTAHSIAAGRLSFIFNLQGPSVVVDTACSSSLVAIHLACQSLRTGESRAAVAGGVSLILSPEMAIGLSKWGFMAGDGRCKTFDARADGFVRGEGCGVVVLKRLSDALADGDRVRAVIRGSAVNQDGRSAVLTAPSGPSQEIVIRRALAMGTVDPAEVTYVEAHGTGTSLGDPIEVEALASVVGKPPDGARCLLGSVKTNIGHLEAAAGVAGLIKVVLALEHEQIPAHLHFQSLNPHISLEGTRLEIQREGRSWPASAGRRFAGISSFGFGGTNAHLVVEEAPSPVARPVADGTGLRTAVLPITATTEQGLKDMAASYVRYLGADDAPAFESICRTAALRRTHHAHRVAVVGRSSREMADALAAYVRGERARDVAVGRVPAARRQGPVFVFCGQGPQSWGMARDLFGVPAFREAFDACAAVIDPLATFALAREFEADEAASRMHETIVAQPALFALQVALASLWRSWGIEPAAVIGHSVGEIAAAHVAGILSLEEAAPIVVARARIMQEATGKGRMVSVRAPAEQLRDVVAAREGVLSVAARNGKDTTVLSGSPEAVADAILELEARGVKCRALPVNYAFHSYQMAPLAGDLARAFAGVKPGRGRVPMVSTVTGDIVSGTQCGPEYWVQNVTRPVAFREAMITVAGHGHDLYVELGPQPVLASAIDECLTEAGVTGTVVPSLQRGRSDMSSMVTSFGALFANGMPVDWTAVSPRSETVVSLPAYAWQRQRYWIDRPAARAISGVEPDPDVHPLVGRPVRTPAIDGCLFEALLSTSAPAFVTDHAIHGTVLMPATGFLAAAIAAGERALGGVRQVCGFVIREPLVLLDDPRRVQTIVGRADETGTADVRIVSQDLAGDEPWIEHATGRIVASDSSAPATLSTQAPPSTAAVIAAADHYAAMRARGCDFGPVFRGVQELRQSGHEAWAHISVPALDGAELEPYWVHPAVLDAALQAVAPLIDEARGGSDTWVPYSIGRMHLLGRTIDSRASAHATVGAADRPELVKARIEVFDEREQPCVVLEDLTLGKASASMFAGSSGRAPRDWFYGIEWKQGQGANSAGESPSHWLIVGDRGGAGARLQAELELRGDTCTLVPEVNGDLLSRGELSPPRKARLRVAYLAGLDAPFNDAVSAETVGEIAREIYAGALLLVQAIARGELDADAIWFVTAGAQRTPANHAPSRAAAAALWGLRRTVALEHPEIRCGCVDLGSELHEVAPLATLLREAVGEPEVALDGETRLVPRLGRVSPLRPSDASRAWRLVPRPRGVLDNLALVGDSRREPGPGEVEVRVQATGLNFRDVLNALGMYPGDPGPLGDECSGVVARVGAGVERFSAGDEVIGIVPGAFASYAVTHADLLVRRPAGLSPAQAAGIPIAFLTAEYALNHVGHLRRAERVLIHAAAGGVGLAAVQLAQRAGAEIFATAGSPEKHAYLRSLGIQHIFSSRTPDFADSIRAITAGRGVDVVLNSLSGEFIARSFDVLAANGRFLEIGRIGIWTAEQARQARPDVSYSVIFMGDVFTSERELSQRMLADIIARCEQGTLRPLVSRDFPIESAAEAFRHMAHARHIGKVTVTQPAAIPVKVRADATYLVTGGTGSLGLHVARWLVASGARRLVLVARREAEASALGAIAEMESAGAAVRLVRADLASSAATRIVADVLADLPRLGGVVHAAGTLDDGVILQQDGSRFARVLAPKLAGASLVRDLARTHRPDFVVLFSSGASVLGSYAQSNYAAANAVLDAFAADLRAGGVRAWAINWGAWAGGGMASAMSERDRARLREHGHGTIAPAQGLAALGRVLQDDRAAQIAVLPIDWPALVEHEPGRRPRPLLSGVASESRPQADAPSSGPSLVESLSRVSPAERRELLAARVRDEVTKVLGLPASSPLEPHQGLRDVGLDSLMAVELKNRLQASVGTTLPATLAFDYPTPAALTQFLADLLQIAPAVAGAQESPAPSTAAEIRAVAALSDAEAEALLVAELAALDRETHGL